MNNAGLFSICSDNLFFGRAALIERLFALPSKESGLSNAVYLCGGRWTGKTEILRRVHKKLFFEQTAVTPVYYQFKDYPDTIAFAEDYLKEILKQFVAFRRRSPDLVATPLTLAGIEKLLGAEKDAEKIREVISRHRLAQKYNDKNAAFQNAVRAHLSISSNTNMPVFLLLDDFDYLDRAVCFAGQSGIKRELLDALNAAPSFIVAGREKGALEGSIINSIEFLPITGLDEDVSSAAFVELCAQNGVECGAEALSAAGQKLEGCPFYIKNLVTSAKRTGGRLLSLKDFARVYADEITGGNTAEALRSYIKLDSLGSLKILKECAENSAKKITSNAGEFADLLAFEETEVNQNIKALSAIGLTEATLGAVKYTGGGVVADFIGYAYDIYVKGLSTGEARTVLINGLLRHGFEVRYSKIRSRLKEEVAGVLTGFDGQKVSKRFLRISVSLAGLEEREGAPLTAPEKDTEITLPQISGFYTAERFEYSEAGPEIIIAEGFEDGRYETAGSIVWFVAIKDATAPVNGEDAENFLRRVSILKENFQGKKTDRWIIGREGFTAVARKILENAGVFTTDGARLNGLKESLFKTHDKDGVSVPYSGFGKEFEVALPSLPRAELVAAKAADEIAAGMGFNEDARGAIKTAVIEACINSFEHGRFKTGKVSVKFTSEKDRLIIHVRNGGADFSVPAPQARNISDGLIKRRGWGLELIKGLMDEVRFEKLSGGAGIEMVKLLGKKGEASDAKQA
ncbi:ATP-binding protein [bacterium]|nr:MAG: ATP-binding protein [bacterium]